MKWNCELIQDLLPLYEEDLCSPASRSAVEAHLTECEHCRRLTKPLPIPEPESPQADRAVAKSIRNVKRRWLTSLIAALLIVPLLLLSVDQYRGAGLCFTNIDDAITAWRFLNALEDRDWETAAKMHDYSGDYESILEALSLPVESWGTSFTPVTLDGETWMVRSCLDRSALDGRADCAIFGFLYNRVGSAMVPVSLWEQVCAVDPGAVEQDGSQYWLNGESYTQVSTPWGDFVISGGQLCDTAADYCSRLDLVPEAVYLEAKADLERDALEVYTATHEAYDFVADMTEEEFLQYMEERYAADLRALEGTVTFDYTGFQGAYRLGENDGWQIQFGVTITCQGESVKAAIAIGTEDGKVQIVSLSHREQADWLDKLANALYPSAHPDY